MSGCQPSDYHCTTTGPPGRRVDGLFDYDYNLIIWISVNFGKLATFGVDSDSHAV